MVSPSGTLPRIDRVIIPAAGFGTRLRPLTHAIPKEMLPLGRKPVLEYVVEEARAAGLTNILFVISPGKETIRRYFGDGLAWGVRCDFVLQPQMRGLGDAVRCGESWTEGQPFAVAFGDCLIESRGEGQESGAPLRRLLETHSRERAAATVLSEVVPREKTGRYGILAPAAGLRDDTCEPFRLRDIVEKPAPAVAPSTRAVAARWALDQRIFPAIRRAAAGPDGEINLTDPVRSLIAEDAPCWAVPLLTGESRRDIGAWDSYLLAAARAAIEDQEFGERIRREIDALRMRDAAQGSASTQASRIMESDA